MRNQVIIFAENKLLPTNHGFESFTFRPVLILDGTVTNMREPVKVKEVPRNESSHTQQ